MAQPQYWAPPGGFVMAPSPYYYPQQPIPVYQGPPPNAWRNPTSSAPIKKAVIVGINYTGQKYALRGCVNDAWNIYRFLTNTLHFPPENILMLTDQPVVEPPNGQPLPAWHPKQKEKDDQQDKKDKKDDHTRSLTQGVANMKVSQMVEAWGSVGNGINKWTSLYEEACKPVATEGTRDIGGGGGYQTGPATKAGMLAGLNWLMSGVKAGDSLFFHFSGHGGQQKDTNGDEEDGMDETLLPSDYATAGMIVDDDLHRILVQGLPKGARLFVLNDCCHSGTGMDLTHVCKCPENKLSQVDKENFKKSDKRAAKKIKKSKKDKKDKKDDKKDKKDDKKDKKDKDDKKDKKDDKKDKKDKDDKKDKKDDKKDKKDKDDKKDKKGKKEDDEDVEDVEAEALTEGFVVAISGCKDDQCSADVSIGGVASGAVSFAFVSAMKHYGLSISYEQLLVTMRQILQETGSRIFQVPMMSTNRADFSFDQKITI